MKKLFTRKNGLILATLIILTGAGLAAIRTFSSPISFAYYEPTYMPPGVTITDKRIRIIDDGNNRNESAALRLETVAWTYSINQFKADNTTTIGNADQNYDETSTAPTCSILTTPKSQEYRLCHWIDNWENHGGGKVSVYEVKFIKGSTYFWGRIPADVGKPLSIKDIGKFIDSFEPRNTDNVRIEKSRYWV